MLDKTLVELDSQQLEAFTFAHVGGLENVMLAHGVGVLHPCLVGSIRDQETPVVKIPDLQIVDGPSEQVLTVLLCRPMPCQ